MRLLNMSLLVNLFLLSNAQAGERENRIDQRLAAFEANPAREMARPLVKRDAEGHPRRNARFPLERIHSRAFVLDKDSLRERLQPELKNRYQTLERGTGAERLVDVPPSRLLRTLPDIERAGLVSARLPETPWSDSYWPLYRGELASRYSDGNFTPLDWWGAYNYANTAPYSLASVFQNLNTGATPAYPIDNLSPAEKYDLLVGDSKGTLTKAMWNDGALFANRGHIATWMGICHGWSAAALMEPRPQSTVVAIAADGHTQIPFYPSDIKALASLLWANNASPSRFVGSRCDVQNPARDENGRILTPQCFDTNPGVWHLAIVNQIGQARRGFVMDATYDYEVWNQPVYGYSYSYFNPARERSVRQLDEAIVPIASFTNDIFRRYRSPDAAFVVGIAMDVTYVVETEPTHASTDGPSRDALRTVTYLYDLELNSNGEIIGGEWRSNRSPDFLWVHPPGARASNASLSSEEWNPRREPFPERWRSTALQVSSARQPLEAVVHALIRATR